MESNHRPLSYQDSVLPLNYTRMNATAAPLGRASPSFWAGTILANGQNKKTTQLFCLRPKILKQLS